MDTYEESEARALTPYEKKFTFADIIKEAYYAVVGSCSTSHGRELSWDGLHWPPKGIVLETEVDVPRHADQIYLQAGRSHAMPPPDAIQMDPEARQQIVRWYRDANGREVEFVEASKMGPVAQPGLHKQARCLST